MIRLAIINYLSNIHRKLIGSVSSLSWSWLPLGGALVLSMLVLYLIEFGLSRQNLYPSPEDRFDVEEIYFQDMAIACPGLPVTLSQDVLEECVKQIDNDKLYKSKIPTFDTVGDFPPNFVTYLMSENPDKAEEIDGIFKEGKVFVVGFELPKGHFTEDDGYFDPETGRLDSKWLKETYALTFRCMRLGKVCVGGRCKREIGQFSEGSFIDLSLPPATTMSSRTNTVWVFGTEAGASIGIFLDEGILSAKKSDLMATQRLYALYRFFQPLKAALYFLSLVLISFVFGITHRRFSDYPLYCYLSASFALWFCILIAGQIFPWLRMKNYHIANLWLWGNVLIAVSAFTLALIRSDKFYRIKVSSYFISAHFFLAILVASIAFQMEMTQLIIIRKILIQAFNLLPLITVLPLALSAVSIQKKINGLRNDPRDSIKIDLRRRRIETLAYSGIWLLFCLSYSFFALQGIGSGNFMEFSSSASASLLFVLSFMLYFTYSKNKTRVDNDAIGEIEKLQRRMIADDFDKFLNRSFYGPMLLVDVGKSSDKDSRKKADLMSAMLSKIHLDLYRRDFHIWLPKSAGDDLKNMLIPKNSNPTADLIELISYTKKSFAEFDIMINGYLPGSFPHISIFYFSNYIFYLNKTQGNSIGFPDFAGSEINIGLGCKEKSDLDGHILIVAPREIFKPELMSLLTKIPTRENEVLFELAVHSKEKLKSDYLSLAKQLNLYFGYVKAEKVQLPKVFEAS